MKQKIIFTLCTSLAFSMALVNNAEAIKLKDVLNAVSNNPHGQANIAGQALQQDPQAVNAAQAVQPGSLVELLMQRTGVNQAQAQGGAGALFQIAKNNMQADTFTQLEQSVPGLQGLLGAASPQPQSGGMAERMSSLAGSSGGTAGNLISVISAFQQQGMSPALIQQFIPVVIDYVKAHGNEALVNSLNAALIGH
ncbi:MAG: DUF2780 domain-containing protein [Gammaproteobacteria bacterium]|nr:DUF2780 domain-containing protein [Gammaproteobacteria bacterium]